MVLPSDHLIEKKDIFNRNVSSGLTLSDDLLITFGIKPTHNSSSYGYIGVNLNSRCKVTEFVEKPNSDIAASLIKSKNFFWNSGIFLLDCNLLDSEYKKLFKNGYVLLKKIFF